MDEEIANENENKIEENETYGSNETVDLIEGGDINSEMVQHHYIMIILLIVLIVMIYFYFNVNNFISLLPQPLKKSMIPYTSGADLRYASTDSSSNRGNYTSGF